MIDHNFKDNVLNYNICNNKTIHFIGREFTFTLIFLNN